MRTLRRSIDTSNNYVINKLDLDLWIVYLILAIRFKPIENQLIHHNMKTFEIEVVRTYTTTIEVALPDELTPSAVKRITLGDTVPRTIRAFENDLYHEIWDKLSEAELQHMDVQTQTVKVTERKSGEQLFNELGFTSEKG